MQDFVQNVAVIGNAGQDPDGAGADGFACLFVVFDSPQVRGPLSRFLCLA